MQLLEYPCPGSGKKTCRKCGRSSMAVVVLTLVVLCVARAAASDQVPEERAEEDWPARALQPVLGSRHQKSRGEDFAVVQTTHVRPQQQQHERGNLRKPSPHRRRPRPYRRRQSPHRRRRPSPYVLDEIEGPGRLRSRARKVYRPRRERRRHTGKAKWRRFSRRPSGTRAAASRGNLLGPRRKDEGEGSELKMCNMTSPLGSPRCNRRCIQSRAWPCRTPGKCTAAERAAASYTTRSRGNIDSRACRGKRLLQRQQHNLLYSDWSSWGWCTRSCKQKRRRRCVKREVCQNSFILETRRCGSRGTRCYKRGKTGGLKPTTRPDSNDNADLGDKAQGGKEADQRRRPSKTTTTTVDKDGGAPSSGSKDKGDKPSGSRKGIEDEEDQNDKGLTGKGDDSKGQDVLSALQDSCGIRPPATRGSYRVVGGQEAQPFSWPWQVAILTRWEEQYCAGTLIAPQWLLTAAHCVRKKGRRRRIVVRAGEHNLEEYEGTEDDVKPSKEFPHPDFDYATITNDIALVHLSRPLKARTRAVTGFACLPDAEFEPDDDSLCYILGWGKRRNTHLFGAEALHEAKVPRVSHRRCQQAFEYEISNVTQLCAGYRRGGRDACAGDSGGPLLCPKTDDAGVTRWFLMGVTSYGEGCGRKGKFGIYTNVVNYRQWVSDTIRSN